MESEGRAGSIAHISALDGARGLAVAGVLFFHGGHLKGGYLGVDFFFTLSGFLITSLLLAESRRTGHVGLGGFWSRRARRLLPALAVLMVGVAIYAAALAKPIELSQIRGDAFATLGYVANWHEILSHQSYFAIFSAPSLLNHTWSLAIEEQFYVIWPLLFVGLLARFGRATPKAVLVTSLMLAAVSSVLMIVLYDPTNTNRDYFGTDTRAAAILFGAALAAWLTIHGPATRRSARIGIEAAGLAGALALGIAWTRLDGQSSTLYRGGFLLCGVAAAAIIAAAVHPQPGVLSRVLSFKPLCALGLISYGLYLYHWPIDVVIDQQRAGIRGWPLFALQTVIALTVAVLSYRFIEQPIRRGRVTSVQLRRFTPAIALALALALFATTSGASRSPATPLGQNQLTASGRIVVAYATQARHSAPPDSERVLLVGNSVAFSLGPAFTALSRQLHITVFDVGVPACGFPPQVSYRPIIVAGHNPNPRTPCDPSWEPAVVNAFRPNIVLWIYDEIPRSDGTYLGRSAMPCSSTFASVYQDALSHEVEVLGSTGGTVAITTSPYSRLFGGAVSDDRGDDCENQLKRAVATRTGTRVVDLFSYICPHGRCRTTQNGVTLRPDGFHYDGRGGQIVAQWLFDQVH